MGSVSARQIPLCRTVRHWQSLCRVSYREGRKGPRQSAETIRTVEVSAEKETGGFIMFARFVATALVVLAAATSAGATAQKENLQLFREVQQQVLQYPHFTIFDSVSAQVDQGTVTLIGKVTMPYKKNDIERRVSKLPSVSRLVNKIGRATCRDRAWIPEGR